MYTKYRYRITTTLSDPCLCMIKSVSTLTSVQWYNYLNLFLLQIIHDKIAIIPRTVGFRVHSRNLDITRPNRIEPIILNRTGPKQPGLNRTGPNRIESNRTKPRIESNRNKPDWIEPDQTGLNRTGSNHWISIVYTWTIMSFSNRFPARSREHKRNNSCNSHQSTAQISCQH